MNRIAFINLSSIFVCLLSMSLARAESVNCRGLYTVPSSFVSGTCMNGRCSGQIFSQRLSSRDDCLGSTTQYQANSNPPAQYVSGECRNGRFHAYISATTLWWNGFCTGGGTFRGQSNESSRSLSGSCTENGSFSANASGNSGMLNGTCTF